MNINENYVIGIDFGTDSVRALIVDAGDGVEVASDVQFYPRWKSGYFCDPAKNQYRQHPKDYIETLKTVVKNALANAPTGAAKKVRGLSVDTTGSTPCAVNKDGTPLALLPEFEDNPNAMFILWKDHTGVQEAGEINTLAKNWGGEDFTKYSGGVYSSEWYWSKILYILRKDPKVREAAFSWVEHCDWIPALLTGTSLANMKRSRTAAGHKAMWHGSWNGLPSEMFLMKLDPVLAGLRSRLFTKTFTADTAVGGLSGEWANELGLTPGTIVGVGSFDAHSGGIGAGATPSVLVKVMGTSSCDMLITPVLKNNERIVKGICGQVDGSIVPGMLGMEAGQSCVGDAYAWFKSILMWPIENLIEESTILDARAKERLVAEFSEKIIPALSAKAEKAGIDKNGIVALDWLNGRRTPDANQLLKGGIAGLSLGSDAPKIFRALVEATAFGAKKIVDRFVAEGIDIKSVLAVGGVARKSAFVMQVHADILNLTIKVSKSANTSALGAAMCAAVVAGIYLNIEQAQQAMGAAIETEYRPDQVNVRKYADLYKKYAKLGSFTENEFCIEN
jgi:L-ribulokinase